MVKRRAMRPRKGDLYVCVRGPGGEILLAALVNLFRARNSLAAR